MWWFISTSLNGCGMLIDFVHFKTAHCSESVLVEFGLTVSFVVYMSLQVFLLIRHLCSHRRRKRTIERTISALGAISNSFYLEIKRKPYLCVQTVYMFAWKLGISNIYTPILRSNLVAQFNTPLKYSMFC